MLLDMVRQSELLQEGTSVHSRHAWGMEKIPRIGVSNTGC